MIDTEILDHIGDVPPTCVHHPRPTEFGAQLIVRGSVFKEYRVFRQDDPVSETLGADARIQTVAVLERGTIDPAYGMGFVVLHHSTEHDVLSICSWRAHQERRDSIFNRPVGARGEWTAVRGGGISPVCCVREMAPIRHERKAWIRYLESERSRDDRIARFGATVQGLA